jgi:glycosyltransferase involved in cell wall biosynthesis
MQEPMRVCQVVGNMNGGGVEQVVMNYYHHVDRSKVQFDFIVTDSSTIIPKEEMESLGARVFIVPAYTKLPAFEATLYDLFREHAEWKIVHSHMNALNVFPLHQAKKAGIPVRISHSHSTWGRGETKKNAAKSLLRPWSKLYPTELFACGRYAGEWLYGRGTDFTVIPNAIDLSKFAFSPEKRSATRGELGIDEGTFVVGHLGRFMTQKNHVYLLDIFAQLLQRRPDSVLLLAGSGPLIDEVKAKTASLGIQDKVYFLGQRSDADQLYSAFDVLCMPSLYEGLPVVGVEAQASGLPLLISSDVTDEVLITSRARKLSLADGPAAWADVLTSITPGVRKEPLSETDAEALGTYDIVRQGQWLTTRYLELAEGVDLIYG